jgi:tetratricopeptide (TPR) repeat protein
MLECLETHADDRMYVHFGLAVDQLRQGSPALAPFAAKYYYAISRLFRSLNNVSTAEDVLEAARRAVPGDPLVLYESATIEEMRATAWQSAQIGPHGGSGGSFRDANALDDILKDRAVRLQHARDWLRQSVGTAPTALARLHYGRVLMMRKEDAEALVQLDAVRKETSDRATQYLSILFTAALDERRGQLETAATRYQEAIDCFPESDAAYTGLSEVLQSAGRGDQARAALHELLKPRPQRHEPWSWYFLEPKSVARERLAALFEEGRR